MNEKLNIQDLIDLAEKNGMSKKNADSFGKFFQLIEEALEKRQVCED